VTRWVTAPEAPAEADRPAERGPAVTGRYIGCLNARMH